MFAKYSTLALHNGGTAAQRSRAHQLLLAALAYASFSSAEAGRVLRSDWDWWWRTPDHHTDPFIASVLSDAAFSRSGPSSSEKLQMAEHTIQSTFPVVGSLTGATQRAALTLLGLDYSIPRPRTVFDEWKSKHFVPPGVANVSAVATAICLFVNPKSGGRKGEELLHLEQDADVGRAHQFSFHLDADGPPTVSANVTVLLFDITDACSRWAGKHALRRLQQGDAQRDSDWLFGSAAAGGAVPPGCADARAHADRALSHHACAGPGPCDVRAVVAGGDGTVTWLLGELLGEEPAIRVPVGVIPLGTGNDLSRQLGTLAGAPRCSGAGSAEAPEITPPSGRLVGPDMGAFMEVMAKFALAPATEFDLWEAVVDVHEAGRLEEVKRKEGEAEARLEPMGHNCRRRAEDGRCLQMRHSMINYASLGFESLIGLEFEKWRSERSDTSQLRNKLKYAELGLRYTMPGIMGSESRDFPGLRYQSLSSFMRSLQDGAPRSQARGGSSVLESSRGVSRESSQASEAAVSGEMQRARGQMQRSNSTGPACDPTGSEYSSMVFMNVECIMGGERKWPRDVPVQPSFDDQKLEALAFTSPVSMKLANGFGVPGFLASTCAVGQYGRPHATFLPGVTTAFQVDGEFYAASDIKSFELQFNQRVELLRLGKAQAYYKAPSIIWGA